MATPPKLGNLATTPNARPKGGSAPTLGGFVPGNSGSLLPGSLFPQSSTTPNGTPTTQTGVSSTRLIKSSPVTEAMPNPADVFAATNAVYQQLLGRNATPDEIAAVQNELGAQSSTEAGAKVATAQGETAAYASLYGDITGGSSVGNAPQSEAQWAASVLQNIGAPVTQNNVNNMMRWMTAEEPTSNWSNRNNPLNASLGTSASDGTGSYANLSVSAQMTARMIQQSNMSGIHNALMSNAPPGTFSAAVVASPWASSHYGGDPNHIAKIPVPGGGAPAGIASQSTPVNWQALSELQKAGLSQADVQALAAKANPSNPIPAVNPTPVGAAQSQQVGSDQVLQNSGGSQIVIGAPELTTYTSVASPTNQATYDAMTQHSAQYQEQNLVNVFDTIQQMLGAPKGGFSNALSVP